MRRVLLSAVVAAVAVGLLVATTGGAQNPGQGQGPGRTFVTYEKADSGAFRFVDAKPFTRLTEQGPRKISAGDAFIIRSTTYSDAATTQRVGTFRVHCLATNSSRRFDRVTFMCSGVDSYADGTVTFRANFRATEPSTTVIAVTGGTGAYEGASGQITSEDPVEGPTKNTVHLVTG